MTDPVCEVYLYNVKYLHLHMLRAILLRPKIYKFVGRVG